MTTQHLPTVALTAIAIAVIAGCGREPEGPSGSVYPSPTQRVFQVQGVVIAVNPTEKTVQIRHEEIPSYMPAMTMPFSVKSTNELAGLNAGDLVSFRLLVTESDDWIDQIRKTGVMLKGEALTSGPFRRVKDVEPLEEGDLLPEYSFTNQNGQVFSTRDFQGKALAVNFLFTRCPLPTFCPQTAKNFAEAQQNLLDRAGSNDDWRLLTITFDPEFDTPAMLKAYGQGYGAKPDRWTLATGSLMEITAFADQLGQRFWKDDTGSINHNLRAAVFNKSGKLQKVFQGNKWTSEELTEEMLTALHH
jgi:protein SCO1/2